VGEVPWRGGTDHVDIDIDWALQGGAAKGQAGRGGGGGAYHCHGAAGAGAGPGWRAWRDLEGGRGRGQGAGQGAGRRALGSQQSRRPHQRYHTTTTYFYWVVFSLKVLVGEVSPQPSTILAGHSASQLLGSTTRPQREAAAARGAGGAQPGSGEGGGQLGGQAVTAEGHRPFLLLSSAQPSHLRTYIH
jgi:hypothetical protein